MSWQATAYVAEITEGITRSEKLLLLCLSNRDNIDAGYAWISIARLAREAIMSPRTCFRVLETLEAKGFITTTRRPGQTSEYRIVGFDTIANMAGVVSGTPAIAVSPLPLPKRGQPLPKTAPTPAIAVSPKPSFLEPTVEPIVEPIVEPKAKLPVIKEQSGRRRPLSQVEGEVPRLQAKYPSLDVPEEFISWSLFLKSKGKTYQDYIAAFETWLRNEVKYARQRNPAPRGSAANASDRATDILAGRR